MMNIATFYIEIADNLSVKRKIKRKIKDFTYAFSPCYSN